MLGGFREHCMQGPWVHVRLFAGGGGLLNNSPGHLHTPGRVQELTFSGTRGQELVDNNAPHPSPMSWVETAEVRSVWFQVGLGRCP